MGSLLVILDSFCPGAAVETLRGPAFEPMDYNGLGAQFLSLKGIGLVAGRAPSLCAEQEGDQEFPCLFWAALAHPFRSEGGVFIVFAKPPSASSGRW